MSVHILDNIRYAIAKQLPDMERGFTIHTNYGDLVIEQEDAAAFVALTGKVLRRKLARLEAGQGTKPARTAGAAS
ncbi:hypothetical protein [Cupriavidus alkaliphilus]|uniref:hypothetical protein n=1 Tax=Cupriavidus alkaliphilus TaxID=942866 RepID=UPI001613A60C|nr:hypothetical protein [Cupriavidus alkaliphilus]MBB2918301.1 hypothetical protein [Cupriavidus alkaliphilus]